MILHFFSLHVKRQRCSVLPLLLFSVASVTAVALLTAQAPPQFRSRVDLVHLDVSVLDQNRRPVRGLGPADFTIEENGRPQQIAVFSSVEIPEPAPPRAAWMREIAPDVRTNEGISDRRLFLILIDDAGVEGDVFAIRQVKIAARGIIDRLGPSDLAAVVFSRANASSVDYTSDRARLLKAVDEYQVGSRGMTVPIPGMQDTEQLAEAADWLFLNYSIGTIQRAVEVMAELPDRRKSIFLVGQGVGMTGDRWNRLKLTFAAAQKGNVTIYPVDVCGLRVPPGPVLRPTCIPGGEVELLQTIANETGGRAVINTNVVDPGLDAIFDENSAYYLLGYQSTDTRLDGRFRRINVRVNRPGLTVRTRRGYDADRPDTAKRKAAEEREPLGAALRGLTPKSDLPLQLSIAPFAGPAGKDATVVVAIGVRQPLPGAGARVVEKVDFLVAAYNNDGKAFGTTRLKADVTVRAGASGLGEYELLSRLALRPGRYQIRIAGNVASLSTSGSLYHEVEVPDFSRDALSMSGIVVSAAMSPPSAPREGLTGVLPVRPTTRRTFSGAEEASVFLRLYQGGKGPTRSVPLRVTIAGATDELFMDRETQVPADGFINRSADINIGLPLARLPGGSYLLTVAAGSNEEVKRRLRFEVR